MSFTIKLKRVLTLLTPYMRLATLIRKATPPLRLPTMTEFLYREQCENDVTDH